MNEPFIPYFNYVNTYPLTMLFADVANGFYENILNMIVKWSGMNVIEYI